MTPSVDYFKLDVRVFRQLAILLVTLLAFALRVYRLDNQSLRGDEAATVLYAALPVTELWELARITDPHPPLYYAVLHPWQWLLGDSAWVMRYAGVLASTLSVVALYGLARRTLGSRRTYAAYGLGGLGGSFPRQQIGKLEGVPRHIIALPDAALLAALLLTVNPLQIWLAQDVRSYPFFTLLGLHSSWTLWAALNSSTRSLAPATPPHRPSNLFAAPNPWLWYVLTTVACLYIHYYTVFLIAFQGGFVLINAKRYWPQRWSWLASQLAIGLLIGPGLGLAYNFLGQAAGGIDKIPVPELLRQTSTALLSGFTLDQHWGLGLSLLLAPVWIAGLIVLLRHNFTAGSFWVLSFAVPVLGVLLLSLDRPFFKERFLAQPQPAFELLLACGFLVLFKWGAGSRNGLRTRPYAPSFLRLASICLLILLISTNAAAISNYANDPVYAKAPPWQLYHDYVRGQAHPGDVMLTNFPEASVSYYSPKGLPFYVVPAERDLPASIRLADTERIANAYQRIWFLPLLRQGFDEHGDVLNWLDRHGDRIDQVFFPLYNLNLYLSPPTIEAVMIDFPTTFAHGIGLRGYQILDKRGRSQLVPPNETGSEYLLRLEPGDEFTLSLYWQATAPTGVPYTVFTHFIASDGFTVTSRDNPPVWGSYPTTDWSPGERITDKYSLTVPPETGPGDYRLRLGWYEPTTLERVPLLAETGQTTLDELILNAILRVEKKE